MEISQIEMLKLTNKNRFDDRSPTLDRFNKV